MNETRKRRDSFQDKYDQIINLSRNELEYIRNKYNWHLKIASGLIILTILCGGWLLADRLSGYEGILDKKFDEILKKTETEQDTLYARFEKETTERIKYLIDKNTSEKEIKTLIKSVVTAKVDSFSQQYLDELIDKNITPKLSVVSNKLGNADDKIQFIEFYLSKVAALNEDRVSFEKLVEISQDKGNNYRIQAGQIVSSIIEKYSRPLIPRKHLILMTTEHDDVFNWNFQQCSDSIFLYTKDERIALLENVIEIKRFTREEKVKLALLVLKKDENLSVVKVASYYLIVTFGLPYKYLEIQKIINSLAKLGYK